MRPEDKPNSYVRGGLAALAAMAAMLLPLLLIPACSEKAKAPAPNFSHVPQIRYKIVYNQSEEFTAHTVSVTPMGLVTFINASTGHQVTLGGNFAIVDRGGVKP